MSVKREFLSIFNTSITARLLLLIEMPEDGVWEEGEEEEDEEEKMEGYEKFNMDWI